MNSLPRWIKISLYILADLFSIIAIGLFVFFSRDFSLNFQVIFLFSLFSYAIILILIFALTGVYSIITLHFGMIDAFKIGLLTIAFNLFVYLFISSVLVDYSPIELAFVFVSEPAILIGLRVARRTLANILGYSKSDKTNLQRTLIIGAGAAGKMVIDELRTNFNLKAQPIVVVDDDPKKWNRQFLNLPVLGPVQSISSIISRFKIQQVIIAIGNINRLRLFELLRIMEKEPVVIRRLPLMEELEKDGQHMKVKDVDVNELLGRDVIPLINDEIKAFIHDQVVLITGAGGSIGSELTRQIFSYAPKAMVLLDIYENGVYDVQQELVKLNKKLVKPIPIYVQIGATYNRERMQQIFIAYQPNLVFHAAAYKHVPLMEDSPQEAVRTNILGTYNIAFLSQQYSVNKMVLVSTDKAVRPTNVMGATKYYAETIMRHFAKEKKGTSYAAVRFGNVLASNGSVIPLFKKQIESGGPVTVTDKNITRFFMTIPEAVGLILQCGVYAADGEIFVLDMGKPVKIIDLAEKMIRQSGYIPYEEIRIEFTGLRPGEKMYEELLLDSKTITRTSNDKIYIEKTEFISFNQKSFDFIVKMANENQSTISNYLFENLSIKK